jgi:hypothetical protein
MSSLFNQASLVVEPAVYENGKVYATKPFDGTGDLTFSRASSATRVASNGLIEKVRTNLILQSETFSNATWGKANTTFSVDTLTANAGTSLKTLNQAQTTQGLQTIYFDVAYVSHSFFQILFGTSATDNQFANFDVQNKVLGTTGGGTISSFIQDFGAYVRIGIVVSTSAKTNVNLAFVDSSSALRAASSASTGSVKVFRSQLEAGDIATDYIATTSAAVSVGPVSGLPRLDYLNSTCPRLLLEPQRTNLALYSEQFNLWSDALGCDIFANTAVSPDGYQSADTLTFGANANSRAFRTTSFSSATYTFSVYAKSSTGKKFRFRISDSAGTQYSADQTTTSTWQRFTYQFTGSPTAIAIANEAAAVVGSIDVWGFQAEAGAYATSYIPTLGTSVTRVADAASKTGISSLIGVNGGSIFLELDANGLTGGGVGNYVFDLSDGTNFDANRISMYWTSANDLSIFYGYGGTFASATYNSNFLTTKKIAVRWTSTQLQVVINGVAQTAVTYGNSSPTKINIASRFNDKELLSSDIKQCLLFNTTLTTAQLQELTTL